MKLVSREEFDARCATLDETRKKLEALQEQLDQLQSG
jgi:BMFP domain-containing protein YqiC